MTDKNTRTRTKQKSLVLINPDSAGIDIGSREHYVCVPADRDDKNVRKFAAFTSDLREMAAWLKKCGIRTIAMESTGVYWISVFQILETSGFEVILVNARHVKNVPGRKTDVKDAQWLQQLIATDYLVHHFVQKTKYVSLGCSLDKETD